MEIFLGVLLIAGMILLISGLIAGEDGAIPVTIGIIAAVLGLWGMLIISLTREEPIHTIETNKPIAPELRITIKDSVTIDTVYIYRVQNYE